MEMLSDQTLLDSFLHLIIFIVHSPMLGTVLDLERKVVLVL